MNRVERTLRRVDRFQQTHPPFAFVFAVVKKFGDDRGSSLCALITYYGFLSLFPLLLVLVTILGALAGESSRIDHFVLNSALTQFPIIGNQLRTNIHGLHTSSPVGLAIGCAGLVWGSLGATASGQYAMAQVWNVPMVERPGFLPRVARCLILLAVLGVFFVISTALAGTATFGAFTPLRTAGAALSVAVNAVMFVAAFRILTPKTVATHDLIAGAVVGGTAWTVLQGLGGLLVGHELRHASQVYGFFGIVLGLLWWIYLGMEIVLYSAEINVVRARRLWPRTMVQPPLTSADRAMLVTYAQQSQRRREFRVSTDGDIATEPAHGASPVSQGN